MFSPEDAPSTTRVKRRVFAHFSFDRSRRSAGEISVIASTQPSQRLTAGVIQPSVALQENEISFELVDYEIRG